MIFLSGRKAANNQKENLVPGGNGRIEGESSEVTESDLFKPTEEKGIYVNDSGFEPVVKINFDEIEDQDGDGLLDSEEAELGTDPTNPDSDGDGLWDNTEVNMGTNPLNPDSDGDGYKDGDELNGGYDPMGPDKIK